MSRTWAIFLAVLLAAGHLAADSQISAGEDGMRSSVLAAMVVASPAGVRPTTARPDPVCTPLFDRLLAFAGAKTIAGRFFARVRPALCRSVPRRPRATSLPSENPDDH